MAVTRRVSSIKKAYHTFCSLPPSQLNKSKINNISLEMPPAKRTRRGKYTRGQISSSLNDTKRQLLEYQGGLVSEESDIERQNVIAQAVEFLHGFKPRPEQIDCVKWLLYEKRDLILVAKTSFGKSLVMQILPCLVPDSIIIVILPLLAIGAEQKEKIVKILGTVARPAFVNGDNVTLELLRDIQRGEYTHILSSPELITGKRFKPLL